MQTDDMLREIKQLKTIFNDMKNYIVDIQNNLNDENPKEAILEKETQKVQKIATEKSKEFDALNTRIEGLFKQISQYANTLKGILIDTKTLKSAFEGESEQAKTRIKSYEAEAIEQIKQEQRKFEDGAVATEKELSAQAETILEKMQAAYERLESLIAKRTDELERSFAKQQKVLDAIENNKQDIRKKLGVNKWMITINATLLVLMVIVLFIIVFH